MRFGPKPALMRAAATAAEPATGWRTGIAALCVAVPRTRRARPPGAATVPRIGPTTCVPFPEVVPFPGGVPGLPRLVYG